MRIISGSDLLLLLLTVVSFGRGSDSEDTLQAVQIIYRHGDRTPVESAATVEGPLTNEGKRQMYELGTYFRARYGNLVNSSFDPLQVAFISSDRGRNLQSSSLVAYGLYRDLNAGAGWSRNNIHYEPIPVRCIPVRQDNIFLRSNVCPRYEQLINGTALKFMEEYRKRNPEVVGLYETRVGGAFDGSTGNPKREVGDFLVFQDATFTNISHNEPVPAWIQKHTKDPDFIAAQLLWEQAQMGTEEQRKLYEGPMLQLLVKEFKSLDKRMILYGAHDRNVFCLLDILNVWDPASTQQPPLGSAVIIELHQAPEELQYLQFWYRNETSTEPQLLNIPDCGEKCNFDLFQTNFHDLLSLDYEVACQL